MKKLLAGLFMVFTISAHADTETIKWYNGNSLYDTTTCQSGGDINLPTPPTKTGYTFAGWRADTYDFSTLNATTAGTANFFYLTSGLCGGGTSDNCDDEEYSLMSPNNEWMTQFPYGRIYGITLCSATAGAAAGEVGNPSNTTGSECWCRANMLTLSNSHTIIYTPPVPLSWVYRYQAGTVQSCYASCAYQCSEYLKTNQAFRSAVLGIETN